MKRLKDKVAVVTGGSRGIGRSICELFADEGAHVIALYKTNFNYEKANVEGYKADVCLDSDIEKLKEFILNKYGKIDILVNNAGIAHGGFLQMTSLSTIKDVFEINFFSQLLIIQIVSKLMMRNKSGSIINMSSIAGLDAYPGYSAYGSSKAALIYATKTLAKELAPFNIRINAVAPGLTETDMATQMEDKAKDIMVGDSAMKRLAQPQEIANMALFLASDLSSFVNGQVMRVDGGM